MESNVNLEGGSKVGDEFWGVAQVVATDGAQKWPWTTPEAIEEVFRRQMAG